MADAPAKRPFWLHQLAEYLLGLALVVVGLQSPTPAPPAVVGGVIIVHAAITKGPFSAFQVIGRRTHRVIDIGVIAFAMLVAVQPIIYIDASTRMIIFGIALVHAFVWWQSNFMEKVRKQAAKEAAAAAAAPQGAAPTSGASPRPATGRSADIGRTAGRIVGAGASTVRKMKANRQQPPD